MVNYRKKKKKVVSEAINMNDISNTLNSQIHDHKIAAFEKYSTFNYNVDKSKLEHSSLKFQSILEY